VHQFQLGMATLSVWFTHDHIADISSSARVAWRE